VCIRDNFGSRPTPVRIDMIANVAEADEHVRTAKKCIYEQERLIERLAEEGQNTS
jgi:hypothetical protein